MFFAIMDKNLINNFFHVSFLVSGFRILGDYILVLM